MRDIRRPLFTYHPSNTFTFQEPYCQLFVSINIIIVSDTKM